MNGFSMEAKNYKSLNSFAKKGACVLFGTGVDKNIPVLEIADACQFNFTIYNRSVSYMSILDAVNLYDTCVLPLEPESVLLHIGKSDAELFRKNPGSFDKAYMALISHIKQCSPKARIAVISVNDNLNNAELFEDMNRHLKAVADAERCEFCDETKPKVWNPDATREVASFLYSQGFIEPLKVRKPLRDIANLLYAYMNVYGMDASFDSMPQVG